MWEFIDRYKLSYPSLYDDGFSRIGCVICPYSVIGKSKSKVNNRRVSMGRWPGMWKAFKNSCRDWFYSKEKSHVDREKYKTFEAYYQAYLDGFE